MTLQEALTEARRRPGTDTLAVWVRETLGEGWPCGWLQPEMFHGPPDHPARMTCKDVGCGCTFESTSCDHIHNERPCVLAFGMEMEPGEAVAMGVGLIECGQELQR